MNEPKKEVELVEVEYWACQNPEHRHRTIAVAQKCIDADNRPKKEVKRWSKEELYALMDRNLAGESKAGLARSLGMSYSNMNRLIDKAERIKRREVWLEKENKSE